MGYDLHITRADLTDEAVPYPISRAEWTAFAGTEPQLIRHTGDGGGECWELLGADGRSWLMNWFQGGIIIWKGHDAGAQLAQIAARFGARVIGDDSAEYLPDGSIIPWKGAEADPVRPSVERRRGRRRMAGALRAPRGALVTPAPGA